MVIHKRSLPRRTFLRGVGATLALPWLDAMRPALTAAASAPLRLGFISVPNGIILPEFLPTIVGKNFDFPRVLKPLEPYRDHLTIVSGLANAAGDALEEGGGPHSRICGSWLSGMRAKRTEGADIQAGTTVDQFAARALGKDTPLPSLQLALEPSFMTGNCEGGYSCAYINTLSWQSPTMPLPMETNPRVVFERLFGADGRDVAGRLRQLRIDGSILDSISQEAAQLRGTLGSDDRRTVADYLDAIRAVEHRIQETERRADHSPVQGDLPLAIPDNFEEHAKLMLDLVVLAYQADITRVITFQLSRELTHRSYPELGAPEAHHDTSHHGNRPDMIEKNVRINTFHMTLFAHLVEKLKATREGDGTLLDHGIMLYGATMGDGNLHRPHNLPIALVGTGSGRLEAGRHVKATFDTPFMNLGLSLLDKVDVELERIGDSTGRVADI